MFVLILLFYLAYRNSVRAKLKGLNTWLWAGITVVSFFSAFLIGIMVVMFGFCADQINTDLVSSADPEVRKAVSEQFADIISGNPLYQITLELFAIGGYLIVRYVLDNKPGKKEEEEVHWMDKLGNNREEID